MGHIITFTKRYAFPLWGWYLTGTIMLAFVNLLALEIPQLIKGIVDTLTSNGDLSKTTHIAYLIIGMGFILLIVRALSRILIFWPGRKIETSLKADMFRKTLALPQAVLLKFGMGDLISRLANDVGQVRVLFAFGLLQFINMIFLLIFTISKMSSIHLGLTIACVIPCSLMVFVTRFAGPHVHKYSKIQQKALGRLTNKVTESFVNVHVIQANAAEQSFQNIASIENDTVYKADIRLVFIRTTMFIMMPLFASIAQIVILLYGGSEAMKGHITVGDIMAFNIYIGLLMFPLTAMGFLIAIYQRAKTAIERIGEIDDAPVETTIVATSADMPTQSTKYTKDTCWLEIKNLNFKYPDMIHADEVTHSTDLGIPFELRNVSFEIKPGERVGIFGPIGSGKSTLFNAITRLFDPDPGTVFWNGQDILSINPQELRRHIGYALQSVHLFSNTVRENLKFGLEGITQEQLDDAAKNACVYDEIMGLDKSWDTEIGERGVRLSGGQKQRMALARIFIRKPLLLILDDVLSAVDHSTEQKLIKNMFAIGGSMLIASHRASALKPCDRILIMNNGEISDQGTYLEMAAKYPDLDQDD